MGYFKLIGGHSYRSGDDVAGERSNDPIYQNVEWVVSHS